MTIRFSTNVPHLLEHKKLQPQYLQPDWFKELKTFFDPGDPDTKTAKTCPGFISMFRICIMIPMWCDFRLTRGRVDPETEEFKPHPDGTFMVPTTAPELFRKEYHGWQQVGRGFPGTYGMDILPKPVSPWLIEMDPGWSMFVMPASLHNKNPLPWEPIPGTFNCDKWHQTNMPCRYTREPELESTIFAGTPFAYLLPFKRTEDPGELELEVVTDRDRWRLLHGEPGSVDYREHLVESHGRTRS